MAARIDAHPQRCWRNAALAVTVFPPLTGYVEGWMVLLRRRTIEIVEHGWCTLADGEIVDPSLVLAERKGQPVIYFPGNTLSKDELARQLPGSIVPLVCHTQYGKDGMGHSGYRQAYQDAWQQARGEAEKRHLPDSAIHERRRTSQRGMTLLERKK